MSKRKSHFGPTTIPAPTGRAMVAAFADGSFAETDTPDAGACCRVIYRYRRRILPLPARLQGEWECVVFSKDESTMDRASRLLLLAMNPRIEIIAEETVPVVRAGG